MNPILSSAVAIYCLRQRCNRVDSLFHPATFAPLGELKMTDSSSDNRLDLLGKRIRQAQKEPQKATTSAAGMAMRVGSELVAGVMVGAGFGYVLDEWVETSPLFLILFLFVGAAAGFKMVIETSQRASDEEQQESVE